MAGIVEGLLLEDAVVQQRLHQRRRSPVDGAEGGVVLGVVFAVQPQQARPRTARGVAELDLQRAHQGDGLQQPSPRRSPRPTVCPYSGNTTRGGCRGPCEVLAARALAAGAPVAQAVQPPGDIVGQGWDVRRTRVDVDQGCNLFRRSNRGRRYHCTPPANAGGGRPCRDPSALRAKGWAGLRHTCFGKGTCIRRSRLFGRWAAFESSRVVRFSRMGKRVYRRLCSPAMEYSRQRAKSLIPATGAMAPSAALVHGAASMSIGPPRCARVAMAVASDFRRETLPQAGPASMHHARLRTDIFTSGVNKGYAG